jgi:hypothetical protein
MNVKLFITANITCIFLFISCAGQSNAFFIPVPDFSIYENGITINRGDIIQTKDGVILEFMPEWLAAFIEGEIEAVEALELYSDKYVFIAVNEGENFTALEKWAENFSAQHDFAVLAAIRIENRLVLNASLYPDDEYGPFFETLIKRSYNQTYTGVVKENTYWIKMRNNNENNVMRNSSPEIYKFFVLLTIDRSTMQSIIRSMIMQTIAAVSPTGPHAVSVSRLRQTFFQGF